MTTISDSINRSIPVIFCFVCGNSIQTLPVIYHPKVHLPVCCTCRGTDAEKIKADELLESLAEGFVCGCI